MNRLLHRFHSDCLRLRLRRVLTGSTGSASLELALMFSFVGAPLMLGAASAGFMVYDSIEVSNAAHAVVQYGSMSSPFASHTAGIQTAAQNEATDLGSSLSVTPTTYYACSQAIAGTQYSTQAAAGAVCPANATNHYLQFIQVNTTAIVQSPVHISGLAQSWTLQGSSVMEVQE